MRGLLILSFVLLATAFTGAASAQTQSNDWPRVGAARLVTANGDPAAGEPVWLFADQAKEHQHAHLKALWATTTNERGRFVLRAPYRGKIRRAAVQNDGYVNFEIVAGAEGRSLWYWAFPARWNGSGWDVEPAILPRRIPPAL